MKKLHRLENEMKRIIFIKGNCPTGKTTNEQINYWQNREDTSHSSELAKSVDGAK
jgi:hypothetical protein